MQREIEQSVGLFGGAYPHRWVDGRCIWEIGVQTLEMHRHKQNDHPQCQRQEFSIEIQ
jgi:hypothetical protein